MTFRLLVALTTELWGTHGLRPRSPRVSQSSVVTASNRHLEGHGVPFRWDHRCLFKISRFCMRILRGWYLKQNIEDNADILLCI